MEINIKKNNNKKKQSWKWQKGPNNKILHKGFKNYPQSRGLINTPTQRRRVQTTTIKVGKLKLTTVKTSPKPLCLVYIT